ncbi:MAG: AI-2E family transporter [Pseudolabrys sp.]
MEIFRIRRTLRDGLIINDPQPIENGSEAWATAAQISTVGIFVLLTGTAIYLCSPVVLPATAALVVGLTLAPLVSRAKRAGIPPWLSAVVLVILLMVVLSAIVTMIAAPVSEWIGRAPQVGETIRQKLYVLDQPLSALRDLQKIFIPSDANAVAVQESQLSMVTPVLAFVTPAVAQVVIFFVALLFFLASHSQIRRYLPSLFSDRNARLRVIRIFNDIGHNLASYLAMVTLINICLGIVVAAGAWAFGIPNPVIFGVLAGVLNYIPYIGPACIVVILLGVGLVTFPDLIHALLPPASFVVLTTIEGQIISPTVLGSRLPLSALAIFLSLVFWAWLWGPIGALLAVPLAIIGRVIFNHVFPSEEPNLPE